MKILLAFDSFKESMSSETAANAFEKGFKEVLPETLVEKRILSDGGEGFIDALTYKDGHKNTATVIDPLHNEIQAEFGLLNKNKTAAIEMARASGLELVPLSQRNPMLTTSYGTGQLIKAALDEKCENILIGIGGSATVDGGCGMAQALGVRFYDQNEELIKKPIGGAELNQISSIDTSDLHLQCKTTKFTIACDVNNPLIGPKGSAAVFGPQKGANKAMVNELEKGLTNLAHILKRDCQCDIADLAGGGAAGGIGAMFSALLRAELKKGIDIVTDAITLEPSIQNADLIISGEGRIDSQTLHGKTVSGVLAYARKHNKKFLAIGGSIVESDIPELSKNGINAFMTLITNITTLEYAIKNGATLMELTGARAANLYRCFNTTH